MDDARAVLGGDVVAGDDAEGFCTLVDGLAVLHGAGFHPREELFVLHADEVCSLASPEDFELLAFFGLEVGGEPCFGQDVDGLLAAIGVLTLDGHVVNLRSDAECRVRGQGPGGSRPGKEVEGEAF